MPSNPTVAQSRTSRLNGAHSQGPATERGKRVSAKNATSHGLRAERLSLTEEECTFAAELRHSLAARVIPTDEAERASLEALVIVEIKLARLDGLEMRALDLAMIDDLDEQPRRMPSLSTLDRYRGRLLRERRELEDRLEALKASRSHLSREGELRPEALRYLAELADRKAHETRQSLAGQPANQNKCTNEPKPSLLAVHNGVDKKTSDQYGTISEDPVAS